jgi:hypothetical protein
MHSDVAIIGFDDVPVGYHVRLRRTAEGRMEERRERRSRHEHA